jgi:hypothetical protein
MQSVWARRLPHPKQTAIRHRASTARISDAGWIIYPESDEVWKAASDWVECAGRNGATRVWEGVLGLEVGVEQDNVFDWMEQEMVGV